MHESYYHTKNIFLTITYQDDHLPPNLEINKPELQNYIKRLRKHIGDEKIRYYAVGEYGDKSQRPHYHLIVFGLGLEDHKLKSSGESGYHILASPAIKAWKKGYVYGGSVTPDSTLYVAGYIQKKLYGQMAKEDGRQQPFALMSNALGKSWLDKNEEQLRRNLHITFHGKPYKVPKYYVRKLDEIIDSETGLKTDSKLLKTDIKMSKDIHWQEKLSHYDTKYPILERGKAERNHRIQTNKNLESFNSLKEKKL